MSCLHVVFIWVHLLSITNDNTPAWQSHFSGCLNQFLSLATLDTEAPCNASWLLILEPQSSRYYQARLLLTSFPNA